MSSLRSWKDVKGNEQIDPSFNKAQFEEAVRNANLEEVTAAVAAAAANAIPKDDPNFQNQTNSSPKRFSSNPPNSIALRSDHVADKLQLQQNQHNQSQFQGYPQQGHSQEPSQQLHNIIDSNSLQQSTQQQSSPLVDCNGIALNPSKRAQQNRNAQRAFRQRKGQYVKSLEAQAARTEELMRELGSLKKENHELKNYILTLQSKLIGDGPNLEAKK